MGGERSNIIGGGVGSFYDRVERRIVGAKAQTFRR